MKELEKTTIEEIWKPIKETNGQYEISNMGRVRSIYRNRILFGKKNLSVDGNIIKGSDNGNGYLYFRYIDASKKAKNIYIHRTVAEAFLEKIPGKTVVNHIDHNKRNNKVDNLEWCTQKENVQHSKHLLKHPRNICRANTGYKYIYKRRNKKSYRVCIPIDDKIKEKYFVNLEYAIAYRDKVCHEIGITI